MLPGYPTWPFTRLTPKEVRHFEKLQKEKEKKQQEQTRNGVGEALL